jgi:hypothetical protein
MPYIEMYSLPSAECNEFTLNSQFVFRAGHLERIQALRGFPPQVRCPQQEEEPVRCFPDPEELLSTCMHSVATAMRLGACAYLGDCQVLRVVES